MLGTLQACADSITSYDILVKHARAIYTIYADADRVQELRERRIPRSINAMQTSRLRRRRPKKRRPPPPTRLPPHIPKGDMVFENAVLFFRDALLTREFSERDQGRNIVLQNWLANPQGKLNSFVEIDLVQEHLNFWIKKIYKADGDGHSWDWLALISPLYLGARQGSKHASPNLEEDIAALMESLAEHEVYIEKEGRVLDDDEKPVPDTLSVGMAALTHGSSSTPLDEFNEQFEVLRRRRGLTPVPDSDNDDDTDAEEDEDLFAESPTLTRLDDGDVEFDMDDVPEWYLDDGDHSDSDEEKMTRRYLCINL
ncbi:hypothetical protein B0H14DRAFT_3532118 [Mycena olivaceomarginata]|nr:hypothetical protein B0H14DRAFT_3532118 [Mycena olivaceomarginata]